jgi:RNA polymerase sigma-70 factor (ECF subfamily)
VTLDVRVRAAVEAGDASGAATTAIQELGPAVLGYVRSLLRDEADAAEAFSRFAEDLWRGIESWRGASSLKTWAYKIAWCAAMDVRASAWKRRVRPLESSEASRLAEDVRTRSAVRDERRRQALDRIRAGLEPEEQSLLYLRIDQEMEWTEIAEVLSASGPRVEPPALRKRFERLKERLAQRLREEGLAD